MAMQWHCGESGEISDASPTPPRRKHQEMEVDPETVTVLHGNHYHTLADAERDSGYIFFVLLMVGGGGWEVVLCACVCGFEGWG